MSKELVSTDMDHKSEFNEDQKSFIDDLHDVQIVNIARRHIRPEEYAFNPAMLINKHGRTMEFKEVGEIQRYCRWLIEIGAVSVRYVESIVVPVSNPAN